MKERTRIDTTCGTCGRPVKNWPADERYILPECGRCTLKMFAVCIVVVALMVGFFVGAAWLFHWAWIEMVRSACERGACK